MKMPRINEEQRLTNQKKIVEVAKDFFAERGYNNTSLNDIIKSMHISKGRFYTYFKSKEALFFEVIYDSDDLIRNTEVAWQNLGDYLEYRLRRYFDETVRISAKYTIEFWASSNLNEEQKNTQKKRYDLFKEDIKMIIEMGQKQGVYKKTVNMDAFVHVLMSCIDGIILLDSVLDHRIDDAVIETTVDVFNTYLKGVEDAN